MRQCDFLAQDGYILPRLPYSTIRRKAVEQMRGGGFFHIGPTLLIIYATAFTGRKRMVYNSGMMNSGPGHVGLFAWYSYVANRDREVHREVQLASPTLESAHDSNLSPAVRSHICLFPSASRMSSADK
jgi:hypothetical protein